MYLLALILATTAVKGEAGGVKVLTELRVKASADALDLSLEAKPPLSPGDLLLHTEGKQLILTLPGVKARPQRLPVKDRMFKRLLLKSLRGRQPSAQLQALMKRKISDEVLQGILVQSEGELLRISIPRNKEIAQRWAQLSEQRALALLEARKPQPLEFQAKPEPVKEPPALKLEPKPQAQPESINPKQKAAVPPLKVESPEDPEERPLFQAKESAEIAALGHSGGGLGSSALLMGLLLLAGIAFFLIRRLRAPQLKGLEGPLIRPLGSHILGPKQRLLLLDVAGQWLLLGSSEKGVQMLSHIEAHPNETTTSGAVQATSGPIQKNPGSIQATSGPIQMGSLAPSPQAPQIQPATQAIPSEALGGFAQRLGRAFKQVRRVADDLESDELERGFFARAEEARREAAEEEALSALCDEIEDEVQAPKRPVPAQADLLQKIRRLQSA